MMQSHLLKMYQHAAWANQRVLRALRDTPQAHGQALPLFAHVLAAEHVWLARLQQLEPLHPVWPTLTLDQCEELAAENAAGYARLLGKLTDAHLDEVLRYRTSQGQPWTTRVVDILTQVALHGPYHRGQIAKLIAAHGGTAPATDYILFLRELDSTAPPPSPPRAA